MILETATIGVILNIVLAYAISPFATAEQIKPPNGAKNLPFISQFVHMIVHHKQVILTSSLIVALVVGLSVFLANKLFGSHDLSSK